jgi:high affinity sulfate transporter 1
MADITETVRYLPIAAWLPKCTSTSIQADILAGISIAGLLVPEGMAYAGIAGAAPQIGLYAAMAGMIAYALFGSSRQLAVTSTSSSAAMTAAVVAPLAGSDPVQYAALISAAAISAGLTFLVGGLFKLGSVAEFISKPVLKGFVFGLGLTIMVKQMSHFTGISKGKGAFFEQLWHVLQSISEINLATIAVGIASLAVLFLLGKFAPRTPSALVVLVLGILAARYFSLEEHGVEVVGEIQARLPSLKIPRVNPDSLGDIIIGTVGIVVVLTAEALAAGRTFAAKHSYETDANQELFAMGAANLASGLFGGMIVGGGMSGTAANDASGAQTQLSTIASSLFVAFTLAFLMPSIRLLPEAVLAAIVIHAVAHLVDFKLLRYYAQIKTGSVWAALTAIFGVLIFGILKGLVLAVGLTLIAVMKKLSTPQESVLGRLPDTNKYVDVQWNPEARPIQGLLIVRPNAMLFFANANRILNHVRTMLRTAESPTRAVILNLEASPEIDITSAEMLGQMNDELKSSGIVLYLAKVPKPVLDLLGRSGFLNKLKEEQICIDVKSAVTSAEQPDSGSINADVLRVPSQ